MQTEVVDVADVEDFARRCGADKTRLCVVYLWAEFHEACKKGGQMDMVFSHLCQTHSAEATFLKVNAEEVDEVAEKFEVSMVPTFLFLIGGQLIDTIQGARPPDIQTALEKNLRLAVLRTNKPASTSATPPAIAAAMPKAPIDLKALTSSSRVMVFIKGSPEAPFCKYSKELIKLLKEENIQYGSFDIFSSEQVRADLKTFSNWPTYPQMYVQGEFVGGLDVIKEMRENGELIELLKPFQMEPVEPLEDKLKRLVNQSPVMLFMKGDPSEPRCGFSSKIVGILNELGIEFGSFDILGDDNVRQGLKTFSDWPTFPQLYGNGALVGGLDIVQELATAGELKDELGA